jgi:hypothetical protein
MDMGDRIQRVWQQFVQHGVNADGLRDVIDDIEWDDDHPFDAYFYVVIGQRDGEPDIEAFNGPMTPDFFQGASASKLVAAIPVHEGMTKQDLIEFDVAEDTGYWDHPDWSDG